MTLARRVTVSMLACAPWLVLEGGNRWSSFFLPDLVVEALEGMDLLVLNHHMHAACNQFCHYVLVKGGVGTEVVIGSSIASSSTSSGDAL